MAFFTSIIPAASDTAAAGLSTGLFPAKKKRCRCQNTQKNCAADEYRPGNFFSGAIGHFLISHRNPSLSTNLPS
jgi:hypothetical protein